MNSPGVLFLIALLTFSAAQTTNNEACGPYPPGKVMPICDGSAAGKYYLMCTLGVFLIQPYRSTPPATSGCNVTPAPVLNICPSGLLYDQTLAACVNPFGAVTGQYAAHPNDPTSYFVKPSLTPVKCPTRQQFFQALDTNTPPCTIVPLPPSPPGASYAVVPLMLNPMNPPPTVPGYTQYYVLYNNGLPMIQRCPDGFIVFQGQCTKLTRRALVRGYQSYQDCGLYSTGDMLSTCDRDKEDYYLICVMGIFLIKQCPPGEIFSAQQKKCIKKPGSGGLDCTNAPDGITGPITGSDADYLVCINGNAVQKTCPTDFVFAPMMGVCIQACSTYEPVVTGQTYYVESPTNPNLYYSCPAGPSAGSQSCPANTVFVQALGSLSPPYFCLNPETINTICKQGISYSAIPILANPACTSTVIAPYYILCNDGEANVQRCPLNSIINSEGYCSIVRSYDCKAYMAQPNPTNTQKCICG